MRRLLSGVLLAVALLLAGCGTPAPASTPPPAVVQMAAPAPVSVSVPGLDAESTLVPLYLDDDRRLQVPPVDQPLQAGYFASGVRPGEVGPAVIAAHVNGRNTAGESVPGLFARLRDLQPGALVHVAREDGSTVTFKVTRSESYAKAEFDTAAVYGDTEGPELRLITCHGRFLTDLRSYEDNLVLFAVAV